MQTKSLLLFIIPILLMQSCKPGSINMFKQSSPHEIYKRKLLGAGLDKTSMGTAWITSSDISFQKALEVPVPYKETGYLAAEKVPVNFYKFNVLRGQRITISLSKKPVNSSLIYLDTWAVKAGNVLEFVASADTLGSPIQIDVKETGSFLLRMQPELLQSSQYTLEINAGPSLGFPTKTGRNNIKSYWGDGRDDNLRRHEGIDIFGSFRSPVVATSNGRVSRVNENNLGGRVVWFVPEGKDYNLYYAHLDQQLVTQGQDVLAGDTLGLMGNTGNAKTTPPHLHFGIYTSSGAVNPLPFINPIIKPLPVISVPLTNLSRKMRTSEKTILRNSLHNSDASISISKGSILTVNAASDRSYKAELPDRSVGFIDARHLVSLSEPIRRIRVSPRQTSVYDSPDDLAPVKLSLKLGQIVNVLGTFGDYNYISDAEEQGGWIKK